MRQPPQWKAPSFGVLSENCVASVYLGRDQAQMWNTCTERHVQLCGRVGFLPLILTFTLFPSQPLHRTSCQKDHVEGPPLEPKHAWEMGCFTNSQYGDLSSGFLKQTDMLISRRIQGPSPRRPQLVSAFTVALAEVALAEPCNTTFLLSSGLPSHTQLWAIGARFNRSLRQIIKVPSLQKTSLWWRDSFSLSEKLADVQRRAFTTSAFPGPSSPKTPRKGAPLHCL